MTAVRHGSGGIAPRDLDQPAFIRVLDPAEVAALEAAPEGVLAGVPFAVKDNIDLAGVPTTAA